MPKKIDVESAKIVTGCRYPPPYDAPCVDRFRHCLGDAAGLTQFGVNYRYRALNYYWVFSYEAADVA